jgi:hypothetical protein
MLAFPCHSAVTAGISKGGVGCGMWMGGSSCREAISGGRNRGNDFVQRFRKLQQGSCDSQHNIFKTPTLDSENDFVGGEQ